MKSGADGRDAAEAPSLRAALAALRGLIGPDLRRRLLISLLLMLLAAVAEFVTIGAVLPFLALLVDPEGAADLPGVGLILDLSGGASAGELIAWSVLLLSLAAILSAAIRLVVLRYTQSLTLAMGHRLARIMVGKVLRQPYPVHLRRNPSEILAGIEKVQVVTAALLQPLLQAVVAAVISLAILLLLVAVEPVAATAAAAVAAAGYFGISRFSRRKLRTNARVLARSQTARIRLLQEAIGGIRDILLSHSQPDFEERYRRADMDFRRAQAVNQFVGQAPRYVVEAVGIVLMGLLALYLGTRPGGLVTAIPVLGVIALGAQRLLPLLQQIYAGWSMATGNLQAVGDLLGLLEEPSAPETAAPAPDDIEPFRRSIEFSGVAFEYAPRRPALHDVGFLIPKGARLGLAGRSGSGKSTLLDLLAGLLRPTAGTIRIDGEPLDEARLPNWQAQIAVVPQEIYLADRSVSANIAFGQPSERIDMDRVRAAAARASIDDFIRSLPDGYDTEVGERGISLSGGQRQRIAIARALYRNANLLIFDEATSALDEETEAEIMGAVAGLGPEITVVLVSHRASSLRGCDLVVRLENGRIARIDGDAANAPKSGTA